MKDAKTLKRQLWGLAKCPQLRLTDEELHLIVNKLTGKGSIRDLTASELTTCLREIGRMKDTANKEERRAERWGGNPQTSRQRAKIGALMEELGWEKRSRVNGLAKRMFGVCDINWLNYQQCSKLIEAMKAMAKRQKGKDE